MTINGLHNRAMEIVGRYKRVEAELVDILQKIDLAKSYREFGCTSLFAYAVEKLGLSEDVAYSFITVARKATKVPALKAAIANAEITVSKAKKITSVLTKENSSHWLELAKRLPRSQLEKEVARVNPKTATQDKATYVTATRMQLMMGVSEELMEKFKRVQDLESQRQQRAVDYEATLEALVECYLTQKDPLRQEPSQKTSPKKKSPQANPLCETPPQQVPGPVPGSAPTQEATAAPLKSVTPILRRIVLQRTNGQCTWKNPDGTRCAQKRWLDIHHIQEQSRGGTHAVENLTTLCHVHHKLVHERTDCHH